MRRDCREFILRSFRRQAAWSLGGIRANDLEMPIGDKQRFAIEIGEFWRQNATLRQVDIWAANRWWTCDDNHVYIPQFRVGIRNTIDWLRSRTNLSLPFPELSPVEAHQRLLAADDESRKQFRFPDWGPTTDNILAHLFRVEEHAVVAFEFWRPEHPFPDELGKTFVCELPASELLSVLEKVLSVLDVPSDA
jgi:hypothetical protein